MSYVVTLRRAAPVARKEHYCSLCGRTIRPGEKYHKQTNIYDGQLYDWKECAHCREFIHLVDLYAHSWDEGITSDTVTEMEPRDIAEARLLVMWKLKWTRRDGSLYEVPEGRVA